jgi:hypothetical protein
VILRVQVQRGEVAAYFVLGVTIGVKYRGELINALLCRF